MPKKYAAPAFMAGKAEAAAYERWLRRRADAHVRRDRRRGNADAIGEAYRVAIHKAVQASQGRDDYTGEMLDWTLLSKWNNLESQGGGRKYKKSFAMLPTVDHVGDGLGAADFRICSWRTNDAKSDLGLDEFLIVCRTVLEHHEFEVSAPKPKRGSARSTQSARE